MNYILNYLWEGSICLFLLYGFYWVFLAKLTFFSWNRTYLMLSLGIVLVIPLLSIQIDSSSDSNIFSGGLQYLLPEYEFNPAQENSLISLPILFQIIVWIYLVGLLISLLHFFIGLLQIFQQIWSSEKFTNNGEILMVNPNFKPSSFFHYIFLPEYLPGDPVQRLIISHEKKHSEFVHTMDCLIFQLFGCIYWFHPFVKMMETSLCGIHEYQVDREIIKSHPKADYARLLVNLIRNGGGKLVNNFNWGMHLSHTLNEVIISWLMDYRFFK
jgi:beta-lactamase regulating signal transducer with metallopeptidase domain